MKNQELTQDDVRKVAKLAKLHLTEKQLEKFQTQLGAIMEYMNLLNEVDTSSVEPTAQVTGLVNVMREDEPKASLSRETLILLAPESENGYIKVRTVFAETDFDV